MTTRPRPLSPHLQIYRWTITMAMSIVQRATGIANYAGLILLALWLLTAAIGPEAFATMNGVLGSWFGQAVLLGWTWSLIHHALGGLRHFAWDNIKGMEPGQREAIAWANIIGSLVLSILVFWLFVWAAGSH